MRIICSVHCLSDLSLKIDRTLGKYNVTNKTLFKSGKIDGFNFDPGSILVFGIPRGGLIVAYEIAK
ncbi:hypothetical protein BH23THE1_BH23THE1_26090 [soil metagenome]